MKLAQCFLGVINSKYVISTVNENGTLTCHACPEMASCDGVDVERCEPGWKIAESAKTCEKCSGNQMCDGSDKQESCSEVPGAESCSEGVIKKCKKNYELSEDGVRCEINKAQGACGVGCIIGVFLVFVLVIGVVVSVLLVFYFKNQKAKIDELMFRSVGSVREGRAVDFGGARQGQNGMVGNAKYRESGLLGKRDSGDISLKRGEKPKFADMKT